MLYRTCKRMIQKGNITGRSTKLDIFYTTSKLTDDKYKELTLVNQLLSAAGKPVLPIDSANSLRIGVLFLLIPHFATRLMPGFFLHRRKTQFFNIPFRLHPGERSV